jgi:ABC-type Fe3+-hydroxamate transport system substrate-binding protein
MKTFKDQIGNILQLENTPKRIVCLVPSLTELLIDLGLEEAIVGVTKFCVHPKTLIKSKTVVGGTKSINFDKIKTLNPDIILCNKEENTKEIVSQCNKIAPVHVSDIYTIKDTIEIITSYGEVFDCKEKAFKINNQLHQLLEDFKFYTKEKKTLKVAYFIWKTPWMAVGNNTFINHLLTLNKFDNVFKNTERYPEIEISELIKHKNLDLILLSSEPYPFKEKHVKELKKDNINCTVLLVDGELFSWYGSRLLKSFSYFKSLREIYENSLSK